MFKRAFAAVIIAAACLTAAAATPAAAATDALGPYPITNNYNGRCLDAAWEYIGSNGTPVQLWDCYGPNSLNQQWYFKPVSGSSEFEIVNVASNRCLDAKLETHGAQGSPVQLWQCYDSHPDNQIWFVYQDGYRNYTIESKAYRRVLDANLGYGGVNGTPVQLWDNLGNGQSNQRWRWL